MASSSPDMRRTPSAWRSHQKSAHPVKPRCISTPVVLRHRVQAARRGAVGVHPGMPGRVSPYRSPAGYRPSGISVLVGSVGKTEKRNERGLAGEEDPRCSTEALPRCAQRQMRPARVGAVRHPSSPARFLLLEPPPPGGGQRPSTTPPLPGRPWRHIFVRLRHAWPAERPPRPRRFVAAHTSGLSGDFSGSAYGCELLFKATLPFATRTNCCGCSLRRETAAQVTPATVVEYQFPAHEPVADTELALSSRDHFPIPASRSGKLL